MKKYFIFGLLAVSVVALNSCKKEDDDPQDTTPTNDSSAPVSHAIIESAYDDMTNMTDQAITGAMVFYKLPKVNYLTPEEYRNGNIDKTPCAVTIVVDTTSSPSSITIDWGTSNCDCNDGKQRRGKIITTFTGKYRDVGTVITHTPVDYYVNDNHIEGTRVVTNQGLNASNQPYFTIDVNGTVTMSSGEVFTYQSNRVRTWTAGFATLTDFFDDEYDISGSANASSNQGNGYTANITTPLHIQVGCAYVKSGILEFTPTGKATRTINYGDGTCDNTFTVTVNGFTFTVNG